MVKEKFSGTGPEQKRDICTCIGENAHAETKAELSPSCRCTCYCHQGQAESEQMGDTSQVSYDANH